MGAATRAAARSAWLNKFDDAAASPSRRTPYCIQRITSLSSYVLRADCKNSLHLLVVASRGKADGVGNEAVGKTSRSGPLGHIDPAASARIRISRRSCGQLCTPCCKNSRCLQKTACSDTMAAANGPASTAAAAGPPAAPPGCRGHFRTEERDFGAELGAGHALPVQFSPPPLPLQPPSLHRLIYFLGATRPCRSDE